MKKTGLFALLVCASLLTGCLDFSAVNTVQEQVNRVSSTIDQAISQAQEQVTWTLLAQVPGLEQLKPSQIEIVQIDETIQQVTTSIASGSIAGLEKTKETIDNVLAGKIVYRNLLDNCTYEVVIPPSGDVSQASHKRLACEPAPMQVKP